MLQKKITQDLKAALKARDKSKISTLRFLLAAIKDKEIDTNKRGGLSEEEVMGVIQNQVKKHRESILAFKKGSRDDLVDKETHELKLLSNYLPQQLSQQELEKVIDDVMENFPSDEPKNFGKIMKLVMEKIKGRADGAKAATLVRKALQ
jgi:uncharacterized protein YqeY